MKILKIITIVILFLIILTISSLIYIDNYLKNNVAINTTLDGVDISKYTKEEVDELIDKEIIKHNNRIITLRFKDKNEQLKLSSLGIIYDNNELSNKIFQDQNGTIIEEVNLLLNRYKHHENYIVEPKFKEEIFKDTIKKIYPEILKKPVDAKLSVEGNNVKIKGGVSGEKVDIDKLKTIILENIQKEKIVINVPTKEIKPNKTKEDIEKMGIKEVIATYTTHLNTSDKERTHNILLASKSINGTILAPGEVFDYNKILGPRTENTGYQNAGVFQNGELVDGIGGGICQVSSTLYNVVLYSNLEIIERHNHSLPVSYVPVGRDATVSWGSKNFKFKNNYDHYIYVQSELKGNALVINIFGTRNSKNVVIQSEKIETVEPPVKEIKDDSLEIGKTIVEKEGSYGYKSITWKIVKKGSEIVSKEKLSSDYYAPTTKVIRVGTKPMTNNE